MLRHCFGKDLDANCIPATSLFKLTRQTPFDGRNKHMTNPQARLLAGAIIAASGLIAFSVKATPSDAQTVSLGAIIIGAIGLGLEWRKALAEDAPQPK